MKQMNPQNPNGENDSQSKIQNGMTYLLALFVTLTLLVYILRGIGWLTFIPGGIILILAALSILTAILYGIQKNRRF